MPISIAIPFYNAEKFLPNAIRSVFAQTYQDWELILIDDGSTDNSLAIAKSIQDPRVRVISDGKNKKLAGRLNQVTHFAKYDFIARMDADDLMDPRRLEIQYAILQNSDFDITSSGLYSVLDDLSLIGIRGEDYEKEITVEDIIYGKKGILHAGLLARKVWYLRNKYDESLPIAQDFDLWLNAINNNDFKIKLIKEPLYIYREESNVNSEKLLKAYSLTSKIFKKHIQSKWIILKFIARSKIKYNVVKILSSLRILDKLQIRRNTVKTIDDLQKEKYNQILITVVGTKVPGLD